MYRSQTAEAYSNVGLTSGYKYNILVLWIWAENFKELLNGNGAASCLELPSSVRREVEVEEIGQEEVQTAMHKMKKGKATGAD